MARQGRDLLRKQPGEVAVDAAISRGTPFITSSFSMSSAA
jgi:hypothetical protein